MYLKNLRVQIEVMEFCSVHEYERFDSSGKQNNTLSMSMSIQIKNEIK